VRALVTGATGFIGSHLVEALIEKGYSVRCTVRPTSDVSLLEQLGVELVQADLLREDSLQRPLQDVDYVYHLAGLTKAPTTERYFQVNAESCRVLFEAVLLYNPGVRGIIHLSSLAASGPATPGQPRRESDRPRPLNDYGSSKLAGQEYALKYSRKLPIVVISPPAVYGPRDTDILAYFKMVSMHLRPMIGLRRKYLSMVYVKDLVSAMILAAESEKGRGEVFFVDDGLIYSWSDLTDQIEAALGRWTVPLFVPQFIVSMVASLAEFVAWLTGTTALLNRQKMLDIKQRAWTCQSDKIRRTLGFESKYPFEHGCLETVAWYKEHGWL